MKTYEQIINNRAHTVAKSIFIRIDTFSISKNGLKKGQKNMPIRAYLKH